MFHANITKTLTSHGWQLAGSVGKDSPSATWKVPWRSGSCPQIHVLRADGLCKLVGSISETTNNGLIPYKSIPRVNKKFYMIVRYKQINS